MVAILHSKENQAGAASVAPPLGARPEGANPATADRDNFRLKKQFDSILKGIRNPAVAGAVQHVLSALSRLREQALRQPADAELARLIRRKSGRAGVVSALNLIATLAILVLAARLVTG